MVPTPGVLIFTMGMDTSEKPLNVSRLILEDKAFVQTMDSACVRFVVSVSRIVVREKYMKACNYKLGATAPTPNTYLFSLDSRKLKCW